MPVTLDEARRSAPGEIVTTSRGAMHAVVRGDPNGAHVLMLHGVTDNTGTWTPLQERLRELRTHALDLPCHGYSDILADTPTLRTMAEWVLAYMDARGIERAVLVGNSMGGGVSLMTAGIAPSRVTGVLSLGGIGMKLPMPFALGLLRRPGFAERMAWFARTPWTWRPLMAGTLAVEPEPKTRERYWNGWSVAGRPKAMRALLRTLEGGEPEPVLRSITARTIIAHGDRDRLVPMYVAEQVTARVKGARLEVMKGIGHCPQVEAVDAVAAFVRDLVR